MTTPYDHDFYINRDKSTRHAANRLLTEVLANMPPPQSAVDVGCGIGTWLSVLAEMGVAHVQGVDGPWVDRSMLQIPKERFMSQNLTEPVRLSRRFDLAISLEVAEHLPESQAESFVGTLTGLADVVLFSGAIPGQGGTHHVNEQWQDWWAGLFSRVGYEAYDLLRPAVWNDSAIPVWYRQNTLLYAKPGALNPGTATTSGLPLNLVHPEQFKSKNMDSLGVKGSLNLLVRSVQRFGRSR
jgi:SAM-dependent methyltransferase